MRPSPVQSCLLGLGKSFETREWWWSHGDVIALNAAELYTFQGLIVYYVNFTSLEFLGKGVVTGRHLRLLGADSVTNRHQQISGLFLFLSCFISEMQGKSV